VETTGPRGADEVDRPAAADPATGASAAPADTVPEPAADIAAVPTGGTAAVGAPAETRVVATVTAPTPGPTEQGSAFTCLDSDEPARIVLRQIDAMRFELVEAFRYHGPSGTWEVRPSDLADTDLASIPLFLSWFVSRYGRHTLAALLHDHLVRNGADLEPPVARHKADEVFLEALRALDVPYLRGLIMWAAVTFGTRWRSGWAVRAALMAWVVGAAAGIVTVGWGVMTLDPWLVLVAAVAPLPAAVLWGRKELRAGVVGGYTLWLVAVPALLNVIAYGVYAMAERVVRRLRIVVVHPRRAGQTAKPPSYSAR
jgi:hypothetical protein